jgi:hypothetical protein
MMAQQRDQLETDLYVRIALSIILTFKVGLWISVSISLFFITSCNELVYTNTAELQLNIADVFPTSEYAFSLLKCLNVAKEEWNKYSVKLLQAGIKL